VSRHGDKLLKLRFERRAYALDFSLHPVLIGVAHFRSARRGRFPGGDREFEGGAAPGFRFHPDPPTLALDDLSAKRQTNARARDFASMQTFKHAEHPVGVLRFDTDSVVPHREQPPFPVSVGRDMDSRCFPASELDRIGNQVLEKLYQHNLLGHHGGQRIGSYDGAALRDGSLEVQQRFGEDRAAIDGSEAVLFPPRYLPIGQQGLEQGLDSQGALHGIGDELVRFSAQLFPRTPAPGAE